jgi:acetylornithine/succinyldiaminopimelate/putrescine aminotransferase/predicted amino acid dehydrogenase
LHPYVEYVNPHLGKLLTQINMDKKYVRGEGCWLYDADGRRYLDMIASYGALPFGFNPPEIWDAIRQVEQSLEPSLVQPSALGPAGELALMLAGLAPGDLKITTFANSGAEAVEAGIKLCRAATGRQGILATKNSFHGKTLGALSATGKPSYQQVFCAPVEGFDFIPYGDIEALKYAFENKPEYYAAFMVEPIQGEGGIVVPPSGYLSEVRKLCDSYGVLMIADEIQTGLGRTGRMFACEEEGVVPDVILLAKALGGGMMPIGACICTENVYTEDFANKHSSTFAANTLACRVGIASLKRLMAEDSALVKTAASTGEYLKSGLMRLKDKYPELIRDVRGKGLMLGIDFGITRDTFPGSLIGVMAEQELLTPVLSSHLLNVYGVRVAPTLNGSSVIRIEPPLIIKKEQCDMALEALEGMFKTLACGNTASLLGYLIGKDNKAIGDDFVMKSHRESCPAEPEDGRFAFLIHPIDIKNYAEFDESLFAFNDSEIQQLVDRWNDMVEPFVVSGVRVKSKTGKTAYGEFITVPRTADEMLNLPQEQVLAEIKAAVELGKQRGAKIIGLGAYTSVAARAGRLLLDEGVAITTGNSYTVVAAVEAVNRAAAKLCLSPDHTTAAVVGATGSIGRSTSILLSENVSQLILIGSPKWPAQSRRRLLKIAGEALVHIVNLALSGKEFIPGTIGEKVVNHPMKPEPDAPIDEYIKFAEQIEGKDGLLVISSNIDAVLPRADVVICATSSPQTLLTPGNIKFGAVVCDMSRPGNVSPEVMQARPDVLVIDGGVIEVPGRPDLGWNFGFDVGLSYACMAETMMLALEKHYEHTSIGSDLNNETITMLRDFAENHGFKVAEFRSFNRPLSEEEWNSVIAARKTTAKASS